MSPELVQQILNELTGSLTIPGGDLTPAYSLLVKAIALIAIYVLARWLSSVLVRTLRRSNLDPRVARVAGQVTFYLLICVAVLWALGGLGLTVLLLLVVVGFALSDVLHNLSAALTISATGFTQRGDWMEINGFEGEVISINLRGVELETFDKRRVMIPNVDVVKNAAVNYSRTDSLRRSLWVSISPEADLAEAQRVIREALRTTQGVLADPAPQVLVAALHGTATSLEIRLWVAPPYDLLPQLLSDATLAIQEALRDQDIPLAVPVTMVVPAEPGRDVGRR